MTIAFSFVKFVAHDASYMLLGINAAKAHVTGNVRRAMNPVVKATTSYGSLSNGIYNRDSCTSSAWSNENVLWNCRDTQLLNAQGNPTEPVIANTASWSTKPSATTPETLVLTSPQGFGSAFYPFEADECPTTLGICSDGTRWVGWPNTGPTVAFIDPDTGAVNAYQFMARQHLSGLSVLNTPDYTLYHILDETGSTSETPSVSADVSGFWTSEQIGYGSSQTVAFGGFVYLYGPTPSGNLAVARSALSDFLGALDDKSTYEYYVNGAWTTTAPSSSDPTIALANTWVTQATIYYSPKWETFVWIGGDPFPEANFYISTAPVPEGPWTEPALFYSGSVGNGSLPAYSAVAHPGLTDGTGDYIFITWTKTIANPADDVYDQPLVRIDWE